jgi:CheY-like chemotaxis protein
MARILLIDDRRVFIDRARALLHCDGHELIEASDALAGLHRAVEDAPDCIVVDLDLAGLDGLEICRQLARGESTRGLPVVVWGAASEAQAGLLARRAGAFAYVDRERTPGALRGSVRGALRDHQPIRTPKAVCPPVRPVSRRA